MADVNANIGVNIDTSNALAQLKLLQREISRFHTSVARSSDAAGLAQRDLQKNFVNGVNSIKGFSAELRTIKTTAESFTNSLEKNKFSMREYFRYSAASTKTFGRFFRSEFDTVNKVAIENVKRLQTQYIKMGRDANGAMKAIAVMPTKLDMTNLSTQTQMAAQKQAIFNQLVKQGSTNLLNFGKNTQWAGRQLMVGFTLPLIGLGSVASKTFMQMESAAIKFKKVYGDLFTAPEETQFALDSIKMLGREFTKYGIAVSQTLDLAAEAAAAGYEGAALTAQVTQATRLQVLGQIDQQKALEATIALQNAFRISSNDLAASVNFLNAVENQTVLSLDDIAQAVPRVGPIITELGGDIKDLAFFLTAMKEGGVSAAQGANALKSGLGRLINPTKAATEYLEKFDIDLKGIIETNAGDLRATVMSFANALQPLDDLSKARAVEKVFGKFQFARTLALLNNITRDGTQAARVLDLASASTEELAALAESELGITAESAMNKFKAAAENLKASLVPIGETFLQVMTPILDKVNSLLEWFNGLSDTSKKVITKVLLYLGGLAPVILMTIGLMANFIANGIKGLLLLRNGFLRLTGQSKILSEQTSFLTLEQQNAIAAAASLEQSHINLQQVFTGEAAAVSQLINEYQRMVIAQNMAAARFPGMMQPGFKAQGYAKGIVSVPGPKGAGDIVPAMLSPGEAVIPAKQNKKYAPLIQGIIANNIPGFNQGTPSVAERFIASNAPRITGVDRRGQTSSEFLASEIEKVPEHLKQAFMELVNGITQETDLALNTLKKKLSEFRSQYNPNAGPRTGKVEFGHIGSGEKQTAQELLASNKIVHEASLSRLQTIATVLPEKEIGLKSGYGVDMRGDLNDALDKTGANLSDFLNDFNERGIEKWRKTVEIGGGNFTDLADQITDYDQQMSRALQQRLDSGATLIFDTRQDIEEAKATATSKGKQFDESVAISLEELDSQLRSNVENLGTGLNQVFSNSLNKITEGRFSLTNDEKDLLRRELGGQEELDSFMGGRRSSARITRGGTDAARTVQGLGNFEQIPNEIIDEVAIGAGTKSPSRKTIPIGEDIARGLQVGMQNQIQETKNMAANLSNTAVSGLINPRTGNPFTVNEIADIKRVSESQVSGMISRTGQTAFLGMPGFPEKPETAGSPQAPTPSDEAPKSRGLVSRGVGKVFGAGGGFGLSGLVFALSMLPGKFGELSKSIMPAIVGLQSFGMLSRIIGTWPTIFVALGAAVYQLNQEIKKAAEEIAESAKLEAEARYGSIESIEEFAEFSGRSLASEREFSRNNRQLISAGADAIKRFAEFYKTEDNRSTKIINKAALKSEGAGMRAAAVDIAQRAAIFGLEPADIAANIRAASDLIGADQVKLRMAVQEILSPDGKDITKEPLSIDARMNFLQEQSKKQISGIAKAVVKIQDTEFRKLGFFDSPLGSTSSEQTYAKTKKNAGIIELRNRGEEEGGFKGFVKRLAAESAMVRPFDFIKGATSPQPLKALAATPLNRPKLQDDQNENAKKYEEDFTIYESLQKRVQSASVQVSAAFLQQTEGLALLNAQYVDGKITKEEYDAQMAISSENFAALNTAGRDLVESLDKIDEEGKLSAAALKDMGNQAFAAIKKSNPAMFKQLSKNMKDLKSSSQIDIMMAYAQGSLTILDVAKLPDLFKQIDGKTLDVAINILTKAGVSTGALEPQIRKELAEIERSIKNYDGPTSGPDAVGLFLLQDRAKKLKVDLEKIQGMKVVNPEGQVTTGDKGPKDDDKKKITDFFKKELNLLKKKRDALKDINSEMDRQNQYQMKQMDLINQASRAKISGNFLEAAQLQQQSMLEGAKFTRESQELQLDRIIKKVENRNSRIKDTQNVTKKDIALRDKLRAGKYESVVPTPTTPSVGFDSRATGFSGSTTTVGGSMYTVTMNISGENAQDIANKVINKLQNLENKKNKSNKVR